MTLIYLIRHCTNDFGGRIICGRRPGIWLNERGRRQAAELAEALVGQGLNAVYASPLERTRQTAEIIAERQGLKISPDERLLEINYGQWTGLTEHDLSSDLLWKRYNTFRIGTRIPGGEIMAEVQARMIACIEEIRGTYREGRVGLVSHGDPIKTVLAYYMGFSLETILHMDIDTGSVSILRIQDQSAHVICINRIAAGLQLA